MLYFIRAGELTTEEVERLIQVIEKPLDAKIPEYFLNHRKDLKDGTSSHSTAQQVDIAKREAIEHLKKIQFEYILIVLLIIWLLVLIVVYVISEMFEYVDNTQRPLVVKGILLVLQRRKMLNLQIHIWLTFINNSIFKK
jgi:hypothetical protein